MLMHSHNVLLCIVVGNLCIYVLVHCLCCSIKLLKISDLCKAVRKDVNGLLSENQLDFVCKVLSNTGKVRNPH